MKKLMIASLCMSFAGAASAQITNSGFEDAFDGWRVSDPNNVITISNIANSGTRSGRIRSNGGRLSQTVEVETNSRYRLTAQLRGAGRLNAEVNGQRTTDRVNNGSEYGPLSIEFETGSSSEAEIFMEFSGSEGRWDDLELTRISGDSSSLIENPSFESAFNDWVVSDPNSVISISNISNSGTRSARIQGSGGRLSQLVDVAENSRYRLTAQLRGAGRINAEVNGQLTTDRVNNGTEFAPISIEFDTGNSDEAEIFMEFSGSEGRWDDFELELITGDSTSDSSSDIDFGLNPNNEPWENFDLSDWALDAPNADPDDGLSARTSDRDFIDGELFPGSEPYFFTGPDGGMVFRSPINGFRTSSNTSFPRSELREMLRAGAGGVSTQGVNENNWVLGYQPNNLDLGADTTGAQDNTPTSVGGRGGRLNVTMRVNRVTSTGSDSQVGRVIIGQIHADNDEPIRLYYRKLPNNDLGSIYFTHEIRDGDDLDDVNLVGSSSSNASNPSDGIALGELFSYEIINDGPVIEVILRSGDRDGPIIGRDSFNMETENSGYDLASEWMYFKAGAYTQNNTGDGDDFDEVVIYRLDNTH